VKARGLAAVVVTFLEVAAHRADEPGVSVKWAAAVAACTADPTGLAFDLAEW
jgi:hypothetical protein